jgi:Amidohydrolase
MAKAALDVNLVLDEVCDGAAPVEQRLDRRSVAAAWVTAAAARTDDPKQHDRRLAHACEGSETLRHVPVLVPPTGEPGAFQRAERLLAAGSRIVRLCPGNHHYPLATWVLSPLPELCQREGAALVLDFGPERVDWVQTVAFARSYPSLPMVVLEADFSDRAVPAVLDRASNVLLHLGRLETLDRIVRLTTIFGRHRFVWGSSERADADEARRAVADSDELTEDARQAILRGNADALQTGSYREAFL